MMMMLSHNSIVTNLLSMHHTDCLDDNDVMVLGTGGVELAWWWWTTTVTKS